MRYAIRHSSKLEYGAPVASARFNLRLKPANWPGQSVREESLTLSPQASVQLDADGPYCVRRTQIEFLSEITSLDIESRFSVDVAARGERIVDCSVSEARRQALASTDISAMSPAPYLFASRIAVIDPQIGEWAMPIVEKADASIHDVARALTSTIHEQFAYEPGATDSKTGPVEAFRLREGVCQDFAHVMIAALRAHGIAASYASGYLRTKPPPGKPRLIGADAMHAWVNVWCGQENGWIGFDPTNDCIVSEDHIQIAMGRDYADVSPVEGNFVGSSPQSMTVSVDVNPCSGED